ncbi:hypothetical protein A2982_00530 [candidate division WWE3 bacterium RIFCSPLOWO2_01_FULL_39_13]|uniref:Uncharacterized protein n=1 Tax=candidate division WWE3 bacterium RIFCSPLOWO2_01_FULL_39_13 TaxID=1802624 RepID=A0A1F4V3H8_UNCKA|nr:MAG: hypothetical protein A2982_00530 [candidate division WWE3 bacterium RIFCSPLOWO2_01_FULL_39_13]
MKRKSPAAKQLEIDRLIQARSSGYAKYPRNTFHLLRDKKLTSSEYLLYSLLLTVIADWDHDHFTIFGSYDLNNREVASFYSASASTVYRAEKKLINKGLLYIRPDERIAIKGFGLYQKKIDVNKGGRVGVLNLHEFVSNAIVNDASFQKDSAKSHIFVNAEWADYKGLRTVDDYVSHIRAFKGVYKDMNEDVDIDPDSDPISDVFENDADEI